VGIERRFHDFDEWIAFATPSRPVPPSPNTRHLMIFIVLLMSIGGRGLARRGRSGKLLIFRLTPRGLRRPRRQATRSCKISCRTRS
jgi:hypothetical protein